MKNPIRMIQLLLALWLWGGITSFTQALPVAETPLLRQQLPDETLAYLRLPQVWGVLAAPKGNALAPALDNPQYQQQLQQLQSAVNGQLLPELEPHIGPIPTLILKYLRSPLELAFLYPKDSPLPVPNVLMVGRIAAESVAGVNQMLLQIKAASPQLDIFKAVDAEGQGILMIRQQPVFVYYQVATQGLYLMAGVTASQVAFNQLLAQLKPNQHRMLALEQAIDNSQQGLFAWMDAEKLAPVLRVGMPVERAQALEKIGFFNMRALAVGWGVSAGKGRFKLMVDAPQAIYHQRLPMGIRNALTLTATSTPAVVAVLSLPLEQLLVLWEQLLLTVKPQEMANYLQFKQQLEEITALPLAELAALFSGEMVYFADNAGDFLGIRVQNVVKLEQLLATLVKRFNLPYQTTERNGMIYHHLALNNQIDFLGSSGLSASSPELDFWEALLYRLSTHLYWVKQGDYLVFSGVPQALMDRQDALANDAGHAVVLNTWLQQQGQNSEHSVLSIAAKTHDLPRDAYYLHLQIVQALADLAGVRLNLFQLPSAGQLKLARIGNYGLQLDFTESTATLEWVFEHNPLEFLGVTTAVVGASMVGTAAAVGIPAYQQYRLRAAEAQAIGQSEASEGDNDNSQSGIVAEGLNLAEPVKQAVTEYYATHQKMPIDNAAAGVPAAYDIADDWVAAVRVDNGVVVVEFSQAIASLAGRTVVLTPYRQDSGNLAWHCGFASIPQGIAATPATAWTTGVDNDHLPVGCRE